MGLQSTRDEAQGSAPSYSQMRLGETLMNLISFFRRCRLSKRIMVLAMSIMVTAPAWAFTGGSGGGASLSQDSSGRPTKGGGQTKKAPPTRDAAKSVAESQPVPSGTPVLVIQNGHTDTVRSVAF